MPMSSLHSRNCVTCLGMWRLLRERVWGRGEASSLWEMSQLMFNMGPEWSEVHIELKLKFNMSEIYIGDIFYQAIGECKH